MIAHSAIPRGRTPVARVEVAPQARVKMERNMYRALLESHWPDKPG